MEPSEDRPLEKRRVAKPALFILISVMFKRYSTATTSSILVLFLHLKLGYDKDVSTAMYHSYSFATSALAIVGAIIADSWFGMYKTIVLMSMVYATGAFIVAIGVVDAFHLPIQIFAVVGLVIMAIGDGCHKPLNRTYGAYQYHTTEVKSIALFFTLYYFAFNCGSITSRLISPILRQDDYITVAFGMSGIFMILVALLTIIANRYSETMQAERTSLAKVFACIWHAILMKIRSTRFQNGPSKGHWLEYSEKKYGKILVADTRVVLQVLVLYLPNTVFWALSYQQASRWVFQAVRMNGDIGFYTIIPDQFNVLNPLLVLLVIPLFENIFDPLLAKVNVQSDLQKISVGGLLAGAAFLLAAFIEFQLENQKYLHMISLLPQYILMAMGEVFITLPLMNFSYTIAPSTMKTTIQAFSNLSIGLGNLIVVIVVGSKLFESQIHEFILFAGLMFFATVLFMFLSKRLRRIESNEN